MVAFNQHPLASVPEFAMLNGNSIMIDIWRTTKRVLHTLVVLMIALMALAGCGKEPSASIASGAQTGPSRAVKNDGAASVDACTRLNRQYSGQGAVLSGAYRSVVAAVASSRFGGRFPEAVPQFLSARPGNRVIFVCSVDDMDLATPVKGDAPPHNRAIFLVDESGESALFMAGYHDTPGRPELPIGPIPPVP